MDSLLFTDVKVGTKSPIRSCVSCRLKADKEDLLRFVYSPEEKIICDIRKKISSRGVYTCRKKDCIEKAIKKKAFSRFLNKEGIEPIFNDLLQDLLKSYESYFRSLMNMLFKSGKIKKGNSAVLNEYEKGSIYLIIISESAGSNTKDKFIDLCNKKNISYIVVDESFLSVTKNNEDLIAVGAVIDEKFADNIKSIWQNFTESKTW